MQGPDLFNFSINYNDVSCPNSEDGSIEIECSGGVSPYTYNWTKDDGDFNSNQEDIFNLSGGIYNVTVTDANNCIYSYSVEIYEPENIEIEATINNPQCSSLLGELSFNITGGHEGNYQYLFQNQTFNYLNNDIIPVNTGEYPFIFIDSEGCLSEEIIINIDPISEDCLQIPTVFTPNGDTQNDVWEIGGIENYPDAQIRIYNRWGQLLFKSNKNYFGNEWDGTHNGEPLPFAVYYYTIDPIIENGKTYNGGITIKR